MYLFKRQPDSSQLLASLLTTLGLTRAVKGQDIHQIIKGHSRNSYFYLSSLKKRKYLILRENNLYLSKKGRDLVERLPFSILKTLKKGNKLQRHELLTARVLFACLQHLDHHNIELIKKEKSNHKGLIPDLNIITKTDNIFIEIDTGTEPIQTIKSKIKAYELNGEDKSVVFFTTSLRLFNHFQDNPAVQFVLLQSPNLSGDILKLKPGKPKLDTPQKADRSTSNNSISNVKLKSNFFPDDLEEKRKEMRKLFNQN